MVCLLYLPCCGAGCFYSGSVSRGSLLGLLEDRQVLKLGDSLGGGGMQDLGPHRPPVHVQAPCFHKATAEGLGGLCWWCHSWGDRAPSSWHTGCRLLAWLLTHAMAVTAPACWCVWGWDLRELPQAQSA